MVKCNSEHIFTWCAIPVPGVYLIAAIIHPFSYQVHDIMLVFIASYVILLIMAIIIRTKFSTVSSSSEYPYTMLAVIIGSAGPFVVLQVWRIAEEFNEDYSAIVGLTSIYVVTAVSQIIMGELNDLIVRSNREMFELPMFALQFFQEFAVNTHFLDAKRAFSIEFFALVSLVAAMDVLVETGFLYEWYYKLLKSDRSYRGRAIYMSKKYQFIRQKIFAENFANIGLLIMAFLEYFFSKDLHFSLIRKAGGFETNHEFRNALIGYTIVVCVEVITGNVCTMLLHLRMMRIRNKALLERSSSDPSSSDAPLNLLDRPNTPGTLDLEYENIGIDIKVGEGKLAEIPEPPSTRIRKSSSLSVMSDNDEKRRGNAGATNDGGLSPRSLGLATLSPPFSPPLPTGPHPSMMSISPTSTLRSHRHPLTGTGTGTGINRSMVNSTIPVASTRNISGTSRFRTKIVRLRTYAKEFPILDPRVNLPLDGYLTRQATHRPILVFGALLGVQAGLLWFSV
mmetsp:Transcript_7886/g.19325  ORF Transcript_7886/g.19325 Transcript_7886/m.19325 type:complete len:508 (+) Transcript_7886:822-2345(+)